MLNRTPGGKRTGVKDGEAEQSHLQWAQQSCRTHPLHRQLPRAHSCALHSSIVKKWYGQHRTQAYHVDSVNGGDELAHDVSYHTGDVHKRSLKRSAGDTCPHVHDKPLSQLEGYSPLQ